MTDFFAGAQEVLHAYTLLPPEIVISAVGILGLFVGSFLNVCIDRIIAGKSILWPPSHCESCGRNLTALDLVPVLSWLCLRGRCRTCGARLSVAYPLSELVTGVLYALAAWRFGVSAELFAALVFTSIFLVLAGIDWRTCLLPDVLTLPAAVLALPASIWIFGLDPVDTLLGGLLGAGVFWALALWWRFRTGSEGLGLGDVKLMLSIGFLTGAMRLPLCVLVACVGALLGFAAVRVFGKKVEGLRMPFGPFLVLGALVTLFFGDTLWGMWLGFLLGKGGVA